MAKIAVTSGAPGDAPKSRPVAGGDGWSVSEVVCSLGPRDRPFEERHRSVLIAIVVSGTFQYRSQAGRVLMTPGSLMLGSLGQPFECSHEHGKGDRCLAFSYSPEFFDRIEAAGVFRSMRVPPLRPLSPLVAHASAALTGSAGFSWEEISLNLAARTAESDRGLAMGTTGASAVARVSRVVRALDAEPNAHHDLASLAARARLSPFHFLRTFQSVTGITPHQYLLRLRLRRAAHRLAAESAKVVDIALECGFGDVSNFNRAFRAEFGVSPRHWRKRQTR